MENATKALLIAAGMLFAVAIVSMGLYAYVQITEYYAAKQDATTTEQITEFNLAYEAYNRDDVTGFELVSLINKIINYNSQNTYASGEGYSFINSDKGWEKMYIEFTLTDSIFTNGIEGFKLFSKTTYNSEHQTTETELIGIINDMQELENEYSATVLSKLVSNRSYLSQFGGNGTKSIAEVLGTNSIDLDDLSTKKICNYEQYIEFKRAEFKCTGTEYNSSTGRIVKMYFEQN